MNQYVTGAAIKELREKNNLTQLQLAEKIGVSDKTVSKWETAKGYPDITLLEPIAEALHVSVTELISGKTIDNLNVSSNMLRSKFYVCPICGNVIHSMGVKKIYYYCNRDGLFSIDVVKGIDDREKSYDDHHERMELEKTAKKLFG